MEKLTAEDAKKSLLISELGGELKTVKFEKEQEKKEVQERIDGLVIKNEKLEKKVTKLKIDRKRSEQTQTAILAFLKLKALRCLACLSRLPKCLRKRPRLATLLRLSLPRRQSQPLNHHPRKRMVNLTAKPPPALEAPSTASHAGQPQRPHHALSNPRKLRRPRALAYGNKIRPQPLRNSRPREAVASRPGVGAWLGYWPMAAGAAKCGTPSLPRGSGGRG